MKLRLQRGGLLLVLLLALICGGARGYAQGVLEYLNGPNNAGRDFWVAFPANWDIPTSSQYYIRLYITSGVRTAVRVWVGPTFKQVVFTKPYDIVTVTLTPIEAQMLQRNDVAPVPNDQVYPGKAVHIEADAPIVLYGVNRTSYTSDGMLILPTNALGREYVVSSYGAVIGVTQELPSQFMVIAPYDSTEVTIEQPMATPNHTAGEQVTVTLNRGDVYSAMSIGYGGDMSGAVVRASKPVAVTAGQNCTYIPNQITFCCCDHLSEMMLPVHGWGKHYKAVPLQTRKKGDFYRIFAAEDNTTVYVNGQQVAMLARRGGTEGMGWFEYRALTRDVQEFTADKPIAVAQYNTSQAYDGVPSDPFYMNLTPAEQYGTELLFATPNDDYPLNYLNLIADSATFRQIEISTDRGATWSTFWNYVGVGAPKSFPTLVNGRRYVGVTADVKPGSYMVRAPQPFGGYIYGFSAYDSYGWPVAATTRDLFGMPPGVPPTGPPTITTQVTDCKGTVEATVTASSQTVPAAALSSIDIMGDSAATNFSREISAYEAGSTAATVRFRVIDPSRQAQAVIVAADMVGNVRFDTVRFIPEGTALQATSHDFGALPVGATVEKIITVTNTGETPREIVSITIQDSSGVYTLESPALPLVLAPGESREIPVRFTPIGEAIFPATIVFRDGCGGVTETTLLGAGRAVSAVETGAGGNAADALTLMPNRTQGAAVTAQLLLARPCTVEMTIINAAGAVVLTPLALPVTLAAGTHTLPVDVGALAAGRYFCRVACGDKVLLQPLTITR